jgi:hypothetical protein
MCSLAVAAGSTILARRRGKQARAGGRAHTRTCGFLFTFLKDWLVYCVLLGTTDEEHLAQRSARARTACPRARARL